MNRCLLKFIYKKISEDFSKHYIVDMIYDDYLELIPEEMWKKLVKKQMNYLLLRMILKISCCLEIKYCI